MTSTKIKEIDIAHLKIASLPSRPTAPKSFGGAGYTATEMKQAFDRLPLYIISRFNDLIDDIGKAGENGLCAAIPSGIDEKHTLADMLKDIKSGIFSSYLDVLGMPLSEAISELRESLRSVNENAESSAEDRASLSARADALEDATEALGILVDALERSLEECNDRHTALAEQHKNDVEAHEARIDALEDEASSRAPLLNELSTAGVVMKLDNLSAHASVSEARLDALEAARSEDRAILDELEVSEVKAKLRSLTAHAETSESRISELEVVSSENKALIDELSEARERDEAFLAELKDADIKANLELLSSHAQASESRLEALETTRAEDKALLDSIAAKVGSGGTTDTIIDCGGPMDLV